MVRGKRLLAAYMASCLMISSNTFTAVAAVGDDESAVAGIAVSLNHYYESSRTPQADIMEYLRPLAAASASTAAETASAAVKTVKVNVRTDGKSVFDESRIDDGSKSEKSGIVNVVGYLNVRSEASIDSTIIGYLYNNTKVDIYDTVENDSGKWYLIKSGEVDGYIFADYVKVGETASADSDYAKAYAITDDKVKATLESYVKDIDYAESVYAEKYGSGEYEAAYNAITYAYELWGYYISDAKNAGYTELVTEAREKQAEVAKKVDIAKKALELAGSDIAANESMAAETSVMYSDNVINSASTALSTYSYGAVAEETKPAATTAEELSAADAKKESTSEYERGTVVSITAYYTGSTKKAGDVISASELAVYADYSDGTWQELKDGWSCDEIGMSLKEGRNTITVKYGSLSSAFEISASAKAETSQEQSEQTVPESSEKTTTESAESTTKPTEPTTESTAESTEPTTESTEATTESAESTTESTEPTTESAEVTTESTEPTTESAESTTEPTEPTTESAEATTEPTEPTTESAESTTESTEPTTESAESTTEPTEPTTESTAATSAERRIISITAVYTGAEKMAGDVVSASELLVVADYSDGTQEQIDEGWSCDKVGMMLSEGVNVITVSYGGFTSSLELNAAAQPTQTETQPTETETQPTETETQPTQTETQPTETETQPTQTETQPTETETQPTETETQPTETETQPTETETESTTAATANNALRDQVVAYALQWVGRCNYQWGGTNLTEGGSVDCSGFTMQVYSRVAGISLPHYSGSQPSCGYSVSDPQPGDLVAFTGHVGIYIGNGQMVHAASETLGIIVSAVSTCSRPFVGYYRLIG